MAKEQGKGQTVGSDWVMTIFTCPLVIGSTRVSSLGLQEDHQKDLTQIRESPTPAQQGSLAPSVILPDGTMNNLSATNGAIGTKSWLGAAAGYSQLSLCMETQKKHKT